MLYKFMIKKMLKASFSKAEKIKTIHMFYREDVDLFAVMEDKGMIFCE